MVSTVPSSTRKTSVVVRDQLTDENLAYAIAGIS
jgi:hypothetical protein